jgi:hypothetical protein
MSSRRWRRFLLEARAATAPLDACALHNTAIPWLIVSSAFTITSRQGLGSLPKLLNQSDLVEAGTRLAAIRVKKRPYDTTTVQRGH